MIEIGSDILRPVRLLLPIAQAFEREWRMMDGLYLCLREMKFSIHFRMLSSWMVLITS